MKKRLPPKTGRQVEEKKPQGPVPDDAKSQVTGKEAQGPNNEPAAQRLLGEDDYWIRLDYKLSLLKEALGIDDDAFCDGLLHQLNRLIPFEDGPENERNFDFVLSVLKDAKPVDTLHANLVFQMALCQLGITRQSEILLKPIHYELPCDVALALHRAAWDTGRMAPQRIKIDDQPVRLMGERMVTRLMQTYAMLLQASTAYRKAVEEARHKAQKNAPARFSRGLNGSRQSGAQINGSPKQQISSTNLQKSNGRASS
jgi:hypothetical protein